MPYVRSGSVLLGPRENALQWKTQPDVSKPWFGNPACPDAGSEMDFPCLSAC